MLQMVEDDHRIKILTSDEAYFHQNGSVKKQNCRYWSQNFAQELQQCPLYINKVTFWVKLAKFGVIGLYFFQENERSVTVN